jgi:hypothetical protein
MQGMPNYQGTNNKSTNYNHNNLCSINHGANYHYKGTNY